MDTHGNRTSRVRKSAAADEIASIERHPSWGTNKIDSY
jgi:hypothetical protein